MLVYLIQNIEIICVFEYAVETDRGNSLECHLGPLLISTLVQEELEDTKGTIRIRISKNR
jgi:hypothetical protein